MNASSSSVKKSSFVTELQSLLSAKLLIDRRLIKSLASVIDSNKTDPKSVMQRMLETR